MNDYETIPRFPHYTSIEQYGISSGDRNIPSFASHSTRHDFRGCPVAGRNRSTSGRELEGEQGGGQPRRRIAVACARCRKRKIRCSGDPGNGAGCENCRNSGADITQCQFHRVGSGDAFNIIAMADPITSRFNGIPNGNSNHNAMMPIYSARSPVFRRQYPTSQYPTTNTKSAYAQPWTSIPFTDDSSVESYGLTSTTCLLGQDSVTTMYAAPESSMRWGQMSQKAIANGNGLYLEHENAVTTYANNGLPYLSTGMSRPITSNEQISPLNMTSLNSTLPVPLTDRQLPIPQSTRAQSTAGVDQMQMRALPAGQGTLNTVVSSNGTYTKAAMPWATNDGMADGRPSSLASSSSSEIMAPTPSRAYVSTTSASEPILGYVAVTGISSPEPSPTCTAPSMSYGSTTSSDSIAISMSSSYSTIRQQALPIATSSESIISRQDSCPNLYSYSSDHSSKRNSPGEVNSTEGTLVNGQTYTPLCQPQSQPKHGVGMEILRRDSFEHRTIPSHRASVSSLNRTSY